MRKIVMYPNKVLREKVPEVLNATEVLADIEILKEILNASDNGAGLASTQLGIVKRFFGLKAGKKIDIYI